MSREWVRARTRSGREPAWAELRHVLAEMDPYSGYGRTVCGKLICEPYSWKTDEDIAASLVQDGIPADLCPKCDRATQIQMLRR